MIIKLKQAHRYDGPTTSGPYGAFARRTYPPGSVLDLPVEYIERALEPYGFSEPFNPPAAAASAKHTALASKKLDELRTMAAELELEVEGTGKGGRVTKADLVAAIGAAQDQAEAEA